MYLLDTNALSEGARPTPNTGYLAWVGATLIEETFISIITLAEIEFGIERLPEGGRRRRLQAWRNDIVDRAYRGRVVPVDASVATAWAKIEARAPKTIPAFDALIAATALAHGLTVVTRNERNFRTTGVTLLNPWTD